MTMSVFVDDAVDLCDLWHKKICDLCIEMHEQWTKKYYGNHCTVQFCTVQFCFVLKHVMALF